MITMYQLRVGSKHHGAQSLVAWFPTGPSAIFTRSSVADSASVLHNTEIKRPGACLLALTSLTAASP